MYSPTTKRRFFASSSYIRSRYAFARSTWERCTGTLKSAMPSAQQQTETTGSPTSQQASLMSRRSLILISSGSAKMSMVSKPISLVFLMPSTVPTGVPAQAELMSPSFMTISPPQKGLAGCEVSSTTDPRLHATRSRVQDLFKLDGPMFLDRLVAGVNQHHGLEAVTATHGGLAAGGKGIQKLSHGALEGIRKPHLTPPGREPAARLKLGRKVD